MATISSAVVLGHVTLARLSTLQLPVALRAHSNALEVAHGAFDEAATQAEAASEAYDAAVAKAESARLAMRSSTNLLAAILGAARPETRTRPFKEFGVASPTNLTYGPRAATARAVSKAAAVVLAAKPKRAARDAAKRCERHASALMAAQAKVVAARSELVRARDHRALLAEEFHAAFETTKLVAKRIWRKDPGTFESVFGKVESTSRETKPPKKKQGKAKGGTKAKGTEAPTPSPTRELTPTLTPTPTLTREPTLTPTPTPPLSN